MKSTIIKNVLGNLGLRPRVKAHVVTSVDFNERAKSIVVGVNFVGYRKKSEDFLFEAEVSALDICVSAHDLYETLADKDGMPAKKVENLAARQIAEKGCLRIYGIKGGKDLDSKATLELSFNSHVLTVQVDLFDIFNFVN